VTGSRTVGTEGTRRGGRSVLVLSNLYPSAAFPGSGPFVRDQVRELARRNTLAVVAPLRITPLRVDVARRVLAEPRVSTEDGVRVTRPWFPGIPVGGLTIEPRLWALRLRPLLRNAQREIDGDLIHAHFAVPDGYAAAHFASRERVPFVLTIWGSDVMQLGRHRRVRRLLARAFAEARAIIAVSAELAERAEALGAHAQRLHVIVGGVPYAPLATREEARARLGIDRDALWVVWVGGLVPVKQPLDAIRAFEVLRTETSRERATHLVMIGDGRLRGAVRDEVRRRGLDVVVHLLGHCPRELVWDWQCAADVLVNSSRTEGTPRAVLEALGAGTPAVGYPLEGVLEVVEALDGGGVAAARTPESLAAAVLEQLAVSRDRKALAEAARERFGIERAGRAIEDVYKTVA
jgi:glycosyltransferase involved in cell wall biosynthesis